MQLSPADVEKLLLQHRFAHDGTPYGSEPRLSTMSHQRFSDSNLPAILARAILVMSGPTRVGEVSVDSGDHH